MSTSRRRRSVAYLAVLGLLALSPAEASARASSPVDRPSVAVAPPALADSWIAFSSSPADGARVFLVAADGSERYPLDVDGRRARAWSTDGGGLFLCDRLRVASVSQPSDCPEQHGVSRADPLAGLRAPFLGTVPRMSPDGSALAYARVRDAAAGVGLTVLDRETSTLTPVLGSLWTIDPHVDWSPGGDALVFAGGYGPIAATKTDLWVVSRDGSVVELVLELPAGQRAGSPTFSPDGQWVAFRLEGDGQPKLAIVRTDGSGLRVLVDDPELVPRDLDWGPSVQPAGLLEWVLRRLVW